MIVSSSKFPPSPLAVLLSDAQASGARLVNEIRQRAPVEPVARPEPSSTRSRVRLDAKTSDVLTQSRNDAGETKDRYPPRQAARAYQIASATTPQVPPPGLGAGVPGAAVTETVSLVV